MRIKGEQEYTGISAGRVLWFCPWPLEAEVEPGEGEWRAYVEADGVVILIDLLRPVCSLYRKGLYSARYGELKSRCRTWEEVRAHLESRARRAWLERRYLEEWLRLPREVRERGVSYPPRELVRRLRRDPTFLASLLLG